MSKPERCQDCPFSYFGHDWRDANCKASNQTLFKALNTESQDYSISRDVFGPNIPKWCPMYTEWFL